MSQKPSVAQSPQTVPWALTPDRLLYAAEGSETLHPERFARIDKGLDHLGADDFFVI